MQQFQIQTVDVDTVQIGYPNMFILMEHLQRIRGNPRSETVQCWARYILICGCDISSYMEWKWDDSCHIPSDVYDWLETMIQTKRRGSQKTYSREDK